MFEFDRISAEQAADKLESGPATLIDIRDESSFTAAHISDARHIDNHGINSFLEQTDKTIPLIIYCYHGNSSQNAARFFVEQGFAEVYSMDGGFATWQTLYPGKISGES